jgi:hypothetical protein
VFRPRVDPVAWLRLSAQADAVQLPLATYAELLVAEAHGYKGEYLATLDSLPSVISADQLRARVLQRTKSECPETTVIPGDPLKVAIDRPLADRIDEICAVLDVTYASYLRALFYDAVGYRPQGHAYRGSQIAAELTEGVLLVKAS